jgi:UPF0042 nucleotide-binding protein
MKTDLVLITGMSGSGKSVALHALEDAGFYCVDNLPPKLLMAFVALIEERQTRKVAVAIDIRSADALPQLPRLIADLAAQQVKVRALFLDATTDTLVRRYSETRRRHPLTSTDEGLATDQQHALVESIELERDLLGQLREQAHVIDTSLIRGPQLQAYVKSMFEGPSNALTLVFESFGFKKGLPLDADFVFDVRMLPNPHYEPLLKPLTGRDAPVAEFLQKVPQVADMQAQIEKFMTHWLPALNSDQRSYVTVAIGCTGGQHRSVFLVEQLARHFEALAKAESRSWVVLKRHRELDGAAAHA